MVAYGLGFILFYLIATELNTGSLVETSVTLFKRGSKVGAASKAGATQDINVDEEKGASGHIINVEEHNLEDGGRSSDMQEKLVAAPIMTDVFSWHHLSYTVPISHGDVKERRLLDDVSGYVAPGKLTALMGESGAGKVRIPSTPLNVYDSHSLTDNAVECPSSTNGHRRRLWRSLRQWTCTSYRFSSTNVRRCLPLMALAYVIRVISGYCQQMDTHLSTTTVREALLFSAKLRQPRSVPDSEKEA